MLGKSDEMIANAIAEMRTYGEGFIIADQSPGLLDMSVIRNTNTKIILSLPDLSDRELVGKSAGLCDEQIKEISKLRQGTAAVYQNEWVSPILCSITKYEREDYEPVKYHDNIESTISNQKAMKAKITDAVLNDRIEVIDELEKSILNANWNVEVKGLLLEHMKDRRAFTEADITNMIFDLYYTDKAKKSIEQFKYEISATEMMKSNLSALTFDRWVDGFDIPRNIETVDQAVVIHLILHKLSNLALLDKEIAEKMYEITKIGG